MITQVEIEGFKSLDTKGNALELGPLNFLVGANAVGKTNLLSALRFIKTAVVTNVQQALNELGGPSAVLSRVKDENYDNSVRMRIVIDPGFGWFPGEGHDFLFDKIDYQFEFSVEEFAVKVISEQLVVDYSYRVQRKRKSKSKSKRKSEGKTTRTKKGQVFSFERDEKRVRILDKGSHFTKERGKNPLVVPKGQETRLALNVVSFFSLPAAWLELEIKHWNFFNISPRLAKQASHVRPDVTLDSSGENLALIIHELQKPENQAVFTSIITQLKAVVPGFKSLKAKRIPIEGKWAFTVVEQYVKRQINPESVSDGTIRLVVLMVIANMVAEDSTLIAIEEPETGIHPHLLEYLVDIFRSSSEESRCQYLVTSHEPDFLDHLVPDEVILVDKVKGLTRFRKAKEIEEIEKFTKNFSLGELWVQGRLGSIP